MVEPMDDMDVDPERRERARRELFKVVRKQVRSGKPREAKRTWKRLRRNGYSKQETFELMAGVLAAEIWEAAHPKGRGHSEELYSERLRMLPNTPWMDEE